VGLLRVLDLLGVGRGASGRYAAPYFSEIWVRAALIAVSDSVVESVRMYVMKPFSYRRCANDMHWLELKRSLRPASCCSVDVMNGA
jgi:hypothetical protein